MLFGAHQSIAGGWWRALERGRAAGCDAVQIFVKNNMQWAGRLPSAEEAGQFKAARGATGIQAVFGHAGYLINLGAPPSSKRDQSIASLIQELRIAQLLGVPFLVLHPGAHLGDGVEAGLDRIARGLDEATRATRGSRVRIALENTAGQGSCLGNDLKHLGEIYARVARPQRLGVCLDTAHLFAAGYDLRAPQGWDRALAELDRAVGLDQILAFHLNDSKTGLGSRVDRHAHIGEGEIGLRGFRQVVRDERFENHPACLETPKSEDLHEDVRNLATLRRLANCRRE